MSSTQEIQDPIGGNVMNERSNRSTTFGPNHVKCAGKLAVSISCFCGLTAPVVSADNGDYGKVGDAIVSQPEAIRVAQISSAPSTRASASSGTQDSGETLEVIVVTAQKRTERLQDVPISMGVLTGEALDASTARDLTDALKEVAGVSLIRTQPGSAVIAIRGVLSGAGTSTTGFYLDEVPFSFIRSSLLPDPGAYDLARIEVLRGPQGTLYGANALNGVVRILTNDADLNIFEVKGRARSSNTKGGGVNWGADTAVNVPLVPEKLAVRGVVSYGHLNGFIDSSLDGGHDINDSRALSYRLKATAQPVDNFTIKTTVARTKQDNDAPTQSGDNLITPFISDQPSTRIYDVYNLVANYDGAAVSVLSSTSYLKFETNGLTQFTGVPRFISGYDAKSLGQELRLSSNFDGPLQFSSGGIYRDTTDKQYQDARNTFPGIYRVTDESESYAVFGDGTYALLDDRLEISGGLRYFWDRQGMSQQGDFSNAPLVAERKHTFEKLTGRGVITFKPQPDTMFYASYSTGFRSGMFQAPSTIQVAPDFPNIEPDTIKNYEAGAKGRIFDGVLTYDMSVYYVDWQDVQQLLRLANNLGARLNAGSASGWGTEGAITLRASQSLTLSAAVSWSGLAVDSDVFSRGVVLFRKGSRLNDSPEWTGSVGGTFRTATGKNGMDFVASSNLSFSSRRPNRFLTGTVVNQSQSGEITDLSASIGLEGEQWSLNLFADNILDEQDAVQAPDPTYGFNASRLWPRTIGLQTTFSF